MTTKHIGFLFGSGISKLSGVPMVDEITKRVTDGKWQAHTSGSFYPAIPSSPVFPSDDTSRAQELIRRLHKRIKKHIYERDGRVPNYEDYFSCLWQIVQDEKFEITNPLIGDFISSFRTETRDLHEAQEPHIWESTGDDAVPNKFASLAERATNLIQWVVYYSVGSVGTPCGLRLISETAQQLDSIDIFSLNHDLLIEQQLRENSIDYADGFGRIDGDAYLFNYSWNEFKGPVRLFKLHGSIDWYRLRLKSIGIDQYGRVPGDADHAMNAAGIQYDPLDTTPAFLTGTSVKERAYGIGVFLEIFEKARHCMNSHQTLVCSGYGWGDKGINIKIDQWLRLNHTNRIIFLHGGGGESLPQKPFWSNRWRKYDEAGRLIIIPKWLSDCSFKDIEPHLVC